MSKKPKVFIFEIGKSKGLPDQRAQLQRSVLGLEEV